MNKGRLIVFSAPSGCGKGTMLEQILKNEDFCVSVSATTRSPREGEVDGVNYYFISKDEFTERIGEGKFLEYAEYCGNFYGTPMDKVNEMLEKGKNVILEIEVQGAVKVMNKRPDALSIFIAPPSINELRRRLHKRGTESDEVIEQRVAQASNEVALAAKYDYIIVNDALEDAVEDFFHVVRAEQLRADKRPEIIADIIKNS
ncbi:MAG: guanylate kinase [Ruminococcus sp.]|nr:guanylate kinase [Ruminococcus sp.]